MRQGEEGAERANGANRMRRGHSERRAEDLGPPMHVMVVVRGLGRAQRGHRTIARAGAAKHTTELPGGRGAIRELVETILKAKGRWEDVIQRYVT